MEARELILRSLEQSQGYLTGALDGLTQEESAWSPGVECNSIAFILWHIARVEDFFVNRVIQRGGEVYEAEGWREKLGTPARETGFQYTAEQLQAWPVPRLEILRGYADSVREKTLAFLEDLTPEKLDEVPRPDRSPDSIGATLGHISTEIALHVGQIAYLRGVQRGLDK
ncbi:MAG: DinB family protein [Dehalococcoidia bacterium]